MHVWLKLWSLVESTRKYFVFVFILHFHVWCWLFLSSNTIQWYTAQRKTKTENKKNENCAERMKSEIRRIKTWTRTYLWAGCTKHSIDMDRIELFVQSVIVFSLFVFWCQIDHSAGRSRWTRKTTVEWKKEAGKKHHMSCLTYCKCLSVTTSNIVYNALSAPPPHYSFTSARLGFIHL